MSTSGTEYHRFQVGELIAERYELVRNLGAGGMGAVYQVIDRTLDNEVIALKLLYPHLIQDGVIFARFRNEVLIARRLAHPNIIRIYDFGRDRDSSAFISMEYIEGISLSQKIYAARHERYTFSQSVEVLLDICHGLAHAHRRSVIHRDLKPDNILLSIHGETRITDFGLARTLEVDKGFTQSGEAVGTPYYMSPEQLRGDDLDIRCDIYALGIIAYEMVVGQRPFEDESYLALAAMHFKEDIPKFATSASGIPAWFQEFVFICGEKERQNRFQKMEEAIAFIEKHRGELGENSVSRPAIRVQARRSSRHSSHRRFRLAWLMGLLLLSICLPLGLAVLIRSHQELQARASGWVLGVEQSFGGSQLEPLRALAAVDLEYGEETFREAITAERALDCLALLTAGLNPNTEVSPGQPALHYAISQGDDRIAELLLDYGADPSALDGSGYTPLMRAAEKNNEWILRRLLEKGVDANAQRVDGSTALLLASAFRSEDQAALSKNLRIIQALLAENANVNVPVKGIGSALTLAAQAGKAPVVALLANASADLNFKDPDGKTALMYAMSAEDEAMIRSLVRDAGGALRHELDLSIRDLKRRTARDYGSLQAKKWLDNVYGTRKPRRTLSTSQPTEKTTIKYQGIKKTRLREKKSAFKVEWLPMAGGNRLRRVSTEIFNAGEITAENIQVYFQLPNGKMFRMQGDSQLKRKKTIRFEWKSNMSSEEVFVKRPRNDVQIVVSCDNCRS